MSFQTQLDIRNNTQKLKHGLSDLNDWLKEVKAGPGERKEGVGKKERALELKSRGNALVGEAKFQDAADIYSEGISVLDETAGHGELLAQLHLNRALCYFKLQRYRKSLADADESIKYKTSVKALFRKASSELKMRHFDEARKSIDECIKLAEPADLASKADCDRLMGEITVGEAKEQEIQLTEARRRLCSTIPGWCKDNPRAPLVDLQIQNIPAPETRVGQGNNPTPITIPAERYIPRSEKMFGRKETH